MNASYFVDSNSGAEFFKHLCSKQCQDHQKKLYQLLGPQKNFRLLLLKICSTGPFHNQYLISYHVRATFEKKIKYFE